jgi:hypothetical protein
MKVTLHDGDRSLTLSLAQLHVLHDLYDVYRAAGSDKTKPVHADVNLAGRQLTVRAPKQVHAQLHAEFKRRS